MGTKRIKKDHHMYKSYTNIDDNVIIGDFEQLINEQKKDDVVYTYTLERFAANVFQDFYSIPIQRAAYPPYHSHNYFEFNYIRSGNCYEYVSRNMLKLKKGDLLIMSPAISHSCYLTPEGEGVNFCLKKKYFETLGSTLYIQNTKSFIKDLSVSPSYYLFHTGESRFLTALLDELCEYLYLQTNSGTHEYLRSTKLLECIVFELHYAITNNKIEYETSSSTFISSSDLFEEITKYITANISSVSREKVKNHFGLSAMTLYRIMQKNGTTYQDFITKIRQRQSLYLLKHTKLQMKEIANHLGFQSTEYFFHFFKEYQKMSPTMYREKYLAESAAAIDAIDKH